MNTADKPKDQAPDKADVALDDTAKRTKSGEKARPVEEIGGRDGPDPTRYGDWERKGMLSDF